MTGTTAVEEIQSLETAPVELPTTFRAGSREHQKLLSAAQNQRAKASNKSFVETVLEGLTHEDRDQINKVSRMSVVEFYTLPGQTVDKLHRIYRRVITLNRMAFLSAAQAEYEKMVAAKQAEAVETVPIDTPPADTVAGEP